MTSTSRAAARTQAAAEPAATAKALPLGYRPNFVAHLTNAAAAVGAEITWLSSDYIAAVTRGPQAATIVGYQFPLNNAAACALADDKSATADVLAWLDVPYVRHMLIRFDGDDGLAAAADRAADAFGFPLVIKPHRGTGGQGVTRVESREAMAVALMCLRVQHQALAASPWVDIASEYRVVVLDDHAELIFEKVRDAPRGDWRNNLKYGSVPEIRSGHWLGGALSDMALRAVGALGLRFASVDIVASGSCLAVLEVNGGVCLERFSAFGADHFERAGAVYAHAVRACLVGETGPQTLP